MKEMNLRKRVLFVLMMFCSLFVMAQETEPKEASDFEFSAQLAMAESDYMVTAGDVYQLLYNAGGTAVNYTMLVDTSYKIRVANLAVLDVRGKSYASLKKQVEEIVMKNYPLSGVQFALAKPAVFYVTVKGEVTRTSEVRSWGLSRLSSVLGHILTEYSSTRQVEVTSSDGKKRTYDLFQAARFGNLDQDPYVRPGDVITVGRTNRKVTISGEVERPGTYELLDGENIHALIDYYGNGFTEFADTSRLEITRLIDANNSNNIGKLHYLTKEDLAADYKLYQYDVVSVPSLKDLKPVAFIEGAIYVSDGVSLEASNRVEVRIVDGMNYATFIRNNKALFGATSDLKNAYIIRDEEQIPIDLFDYLYDVSFYSEDEVQPYDILVIPFKQYFVSVSGAVYKPGRYPYIPDRTYDYYIGLAGGFNRSQNAHDAVVIRDMNGKKLSKKDFITPESNIEAKTNSFGFFFNQYAPIVTTILSILTSALSIVAIFSTYSR